MTANAVKNLSEPGLHPDGGGLYLNVKASGAKSWTFRYRRDGRLRESGLGAYPAVSLADARRKRDDAKALLAEGIDPLAKPDDGTSSVPLFGEFAMDHLDEIEKGFKNEKHRQQWRNTLKTYGKPIWGKPLDRITTEDVLECISPIWLTKHETATRVRGRIEKVLAVARVRKLRTGENPAMWKNHLELLLPAYKKRVEHHAALHYPEAPAFFAKLQTRPAVAARALEVLILTACRTNEIIGLKDTELDLEAKLWTIPAERMKGNRPHIVPLTDRAVEILKKHAKDFDKLSNMAMAMLLRRMKYDAITVHGFRSTFRDWAGEETEFDPQTIEFALAHIPGDKAEKAYRRLSAVAKRRELMAAWERYLLPAAAAE